MITLKIKKTLLIISFIIFIITTAKSQEKIQFGVKGGLNFTNMTSDIMIEKEYKTGFHIGVLAEISFRAKFSLQPEILYSKQGANGKVILLNVPFPDGPGVPPIPTEYELDYIQISILAKIYLIENFSLEIGPSFNFLVNDKLIYETVTINEIGESFELSGILGLSYKIKSHFFVNTRYFLGFTDALEVEYWNSKNHGFSIGIGYMFKR